LARAAFDERGYTVHTPTLLSVTVAIIDDWIARNHVLATA
jgi:hypothetical protein